ncbi:zinc finger MYM-type containing 1 [Chelydra serpentina]|uniref:Zinc finger MYM-type containing 1 n=1 Tax=Chelydra serpentina TaxID=8475 RepID=A0A8T1SGB3_CHESE|nr:zinc finger MYM-type containing 1 [Chelydra serpentina]
MLTIMNRHNLQPVFPNVFVALRIYLTLPVSNCSGERSFSQLKRIKSALRATMVQERLNSLTLLSIESEMINSIDFSS